MSLCHKFHSGGGAQTPPEDTTFGHEPTYTPSRSQHGQPSMESSVGVRRRRDSNDFDCGLEDSMVITRPAGTAPITPATKKRLKMSCKEVARNFNVDPNELNTFVEVRPPLP